MGSFMANDGKYIGCGQFFIALEPKVFSGGLFDKQIAALIKSVVSQAGARMPNSRRTENQKRLKSEGLTIELPLFEKLKQFASGARAI